MKSAAVHCAEKRVRYVECHPARTGGKEAGYSVVIQAWDCPPGSDFALFMHRAIMETRKTIAVLSETYLSSEYTQPEWAAAFAQPNPRPLALKGRNNHVASPLFRPFRANGLGLGPASQGVALGWHV
jgi:hypothetical protein